MKKDSDLRQRRHELGLSIRAVALKAGISVAAVRSMEIGLYRGKLMTRTKLARALDVSLLSLMTPEERQATRVYRIQEFEDAPVKEIAALVEKKDVTPEGRKIIKSWLEATGGRRRG